MREYLVIPHHSLYYPSSSG